MPSPERGRARFLRYARRRAYRTAAVLMPAAVILIVAPASNGPPAEKQALPAMPDPPPPGPALIRDAREIALLQLNLRSALQAGRTSAVILDTSLPEGRDLIYESAAAERYELASVSKVYILAAYLDLVEQQGREANEWEREMMTVMIEASDNTSASDLWSELDKSDGLQAFLRSRGLAEIEPPEIEAEWGEMRASPLDVSRLLRALYDGRLLNQEHTSFALDLLGNIVEEQAWGVGTAGEGLGLETYVKNGWYPEESGWIVNSAGLLPHSGGAYVLVVLTESQPSLEEGVDFIENAVDIFREGLVTEGGPGELQPDFSLPPDPTHPGPEDQPDNP